MSPRLSKRQPGQYDRDDKDVKLLEELRIDIQDSIDSQAPYNAKWREAGEYMKGNHYVTVGNDLNVQPMVQQDANSIRMVKNLFGSSVRIAVSKLLAN